MIKNFIIILNPAAGKGHAEKSIPTIKTFMESHALNYRLIITEKPGHAITLAAESLSEPNAAIIAAGGDGTCNEVINGLMAYRDTNGKSVKTPIPTFGVLPIGRGNDFAYGAGLPDTLEENLALLTEPHTSPIDIGLVKGGDYPDGRFFGNGIGVGFDTKVGLEAEKMKHIHGAAGYALGAIKTLIIYPKAPVLEITYNNKTITEEPALVSIMNGKRMGGAFYMAPEGINHDGLLNLCMTKQGSRRKLLKAMLHYTKGTQATLDDTKTDTAESYHLLAVEGELAVHADGEIICIAGKELAVSCFRHALLFIGKKASV
ncbi:MAG: diacylglycerol kinase family lipid kinase [Bacteroidetes bacterium]|nr:diacylglycerol kinase family lipid kinase [Bacteroidota bacterium]